MSLINQTFPHAELQHAYPLRTINSNIHYTNLSTALLLRMCHDSSESDFRGLNNTLKLFSHWSESGD